MRVWVVVPVLASILFLGIVVPTILAEDSFTAQASLIDTQAKAVSLTLSETITIDDTITIVQPKT